MKGVFKLAAVVVVFLCVFSITWFVYFPHSPLGRQEANLKLAENHLLIARDRLRQVKGAEKVKVGVYNGLDGSLSVFGDVESERTVEAVMSEILATAPPVTVQ